MSVCPSLPSYHPSSFRPSHFSCPREICTVIILIRCNLIWSISVDNMRIVLGRSNDCSCNYCLVLINLLFSNGFFFTSARDLMKLMIKFVYEVLNFCESKIWSILIGWTFTYYHDCCFSEFLGCYCILNKSCFHTINPSNMKSKIRMHRSVTRIVLFFVFLQKISF